MDNQPPVDRSILLPILIGAFSIFGILIILLLGRTSASRAPVVEEPTETPFDFIFLGTEPGPTGTAGPEVTGATEAGLFTATPFEIGTGIPTERSPVVTPDLGIPNLTPIATAAGPIVLTPGPVIPNVTPITSAPTSTSASGPPLNPGTYDDVDSHLVYDGSWASQTSIAGAHQGTLHVSTVPTSSVTFRFIGTQVRITYLSGSSLGEAIITIDNNPNLSFIVDQSDAQNGSEWVSPILSNATHTVIFSHNSGGSINLDSVIIPEVAPTGTATATPTRTPTE